MVTITFRIETWDVAFNNFVLLGLDDLMKELQQDYGSKQIRSVCVSKGPSHLVHHCFKTAAPLDPIMTLYDFMARHHPNDLFHRIWSAASWRAVKEKPDLTIKDIVTKIWNPAFKECCRVLDSLQDHSMKLKEVNDRFYQFDDGNMIIAHLEKLYKGVELCHRRSPPTKHPSWIDSAVECMQQYWTLCRYAKAAQTVLQLKQKLELTGDFSLMETIAKKVSLMISSSDV